MVALMNAPASNRTTLALSPEESWRVRRELFGLNQTLPPTPEAQALLEQERRAVVSGLYETI